MFNQWNTKNFRRLIENSYGKMWWNMVRLIYLIQWVCKKMVFLVIEKNDFVKTILLLKDLYTIGLASAEIIIFNKAPNKYMKCYCFQTPLQQCLLQRRLRPMFRRSSRLLWMWPSMRTSVWRSLPALPPTASRSSCLRQHHWQPST